MYMLDTDVLSATSPTRQDDNKPLAEWINSHSDNLFLSAVTIAEITKGIAKLRRTGSASKATLLQNWLDLTLHFYAQRVLPFDVAAARTAGTLNDHALASGHNPGFADIAIAATALNHDLVLLTRNLRHFTPLDIPAHDPFQSIPQPPVTP